MAIQIISKKCSQNYLHIKTNELFYSLKDIIYFDERSFYIIKPNYYKNWHPAIARLDLIEFNRPNPFQKEWRGKLMRGFKTETINSAFDAGIINFIIAHLAKCSKQMKNGLCCYR